MYGIHSGTCLAHAYSTAADASPTGHRPYGAKL